MKMCSRVSTGDVIDLSKTDCKLLGNIPVGEYVVEDARDSGGWRVQIRKLDGAGNYVRDNTFVQFYQSSGYSYFLPNVRVVRMMLKTFI